MQAYTANLEPLRRPEQVSTTTVTSAWSPAHDSSSWESWQSQPAEGQTRFGSSWVVTRHERSPSPMPFATPTMERRSVHTTQHPQAATGTTEELPAVPKEASSFPGVSRVLSDASIDDELRTLSSIASRQEPASGEVKLVESEFKREVEPLNLVSSRVVRDTDEKKTIELKFQEKVQLVHYSFQLPSYAELVQAPQEDVHEAEPLTSTSVGSVSASEVAQDIKSTTEAYTMSTQGSETGSWKPTQGTSMPEVVSGVETTQYSQGWTTSHFTQRDAKAPSTLPSGVEEPDKASVPWPGIHAQQHVTRIPFETQPALGEDVKSTVVFPVDSRTETSWSETRPSGEVVTRSTVTVRQLSPEKGSTSDARRLFFGIEPAEEKGKESQPRKPVLLTQNADLSGVPGKEKADATILESQAPESPAHRLTTSTVDVGTTVYTATTELVSTAPGQQTAMKLHQEPEKAFGQGLQANGHPKHLEPQGTESPALVTETIHGRPDDSVQPVSSMPSTEPDSKTLQSEEQQTIALPSGKEAVRLPSVDKEGRDATDHEGPANGEPKQLKKSSKQRKKEQSPSSTEKTSETKTTASPLDRLGKKVKKFALHLFSGDSKHSTETPTVEDAKKGQPPQADIAEETKKEKKKRSKKKGKAPLPEQSSHIGMPQAEIASDRDDTTQLAVTEELESIQEDNSALVDFQAGTQADVSSKPGVASLDAEHSRSVPTSVLDGKVPDTTPETVHMSFYTTADTQQDTPRTTETHPAADTNRVVTKGEISKDHMPTGNQQPHDESSMVPSYIPVYPQPSIAGKGQSPKKSVPIQPVDASKVGTGEAGNSLDERTLTIIYGVPTITTTKIVQSARHDDKQPTVPQRGETTQERKSRHVIFDSKLLGQQQEAQDKNEPAGKKKKSKTKDLPKMPGDKHGQDSVMTAVITHVIEKGEQGPSSTGFASRESLLEPQPDREKEQPGQDSGLEKPSELPGDQGHRTVIIEEKTRVVKVSDWEPVSDRTVDTAKPHPSRKTSTSTETREDDEEPGKEKVRPEALSKVPDETYPGKPTVTEASSVIPGEEVLSPHDVSSDKHPEAPKHLGKEDSSKHLPTDTVLSLTPDTKSIQQPEDNKKPSKRRRKASRPSQVENQESRNMTIVTSLQNSLT
ncbi:hypothetical protein V5799_008974 [Amblyomma americanum]|uniref:Uncharacterized protein n=1 Tax=Amblyomma americanum TaxID=6943 RepID=A0AAQ4FDA4_AMBAM